MRGSEPRCQVSASLAPAPERAQSIIRTAASAKSHTIRSPQANESHSPAHTTPITSRAFSWHIPAAQGTCETLISSHCDETFPGQRPGQVNGYLCGGDHYADIPAHAGIHASFRNQEMDGAGVAEYERDSGPVWHPGQAPGVTDHSMQQPRANRWLKVLLSHDPDARVTYGYRSKGLHRRFRSAFRLPRPAPLPWLP